MGILVLHGDGMLVVIVNVSSEDGSLISPPEIITRGFIYVKEAEELMQGMKEIVISVVESCEGRRRTDWTTIKGTIKGELSTYLYKQTKRNPMILPVITEV